MLDFAWLHHEIDSLFHAADAGRGQNTPAMEMWAQDVAALFGIVGITPHHHFDLHF
jgi:hypothetical protein